MRTRWWWSLLLLASVFAMHGPSCAAADPASSATGTEVAAPAIVAASLAMPAAVGVPAVMSATGDIAPMAGHAAMGASVGEPADLSASPASGGVHAAGAGVPTDHPAGHDGLLHALAVCLAVLVAAAGGILAALAVWLARRRLTGATQRVRVRIGRFLDRASACLPGPEFSRLCVLRI